MMKLEKRSNLRMHKQNSPQSDSFKLALANELLNGFNNDKKFIRAICKKLKLHNVAYGEDYDKLQQEYLDKLAEFAKSLPEYETMLKLTNYK